MMLLKLFFIAVTSLSALCCSNSISNVEISAFLFEDGNLTVDCFEIDSSECLIQLKTYKSANKLHLTGFVFDEVNVKQLSNVICEMHLQELTLDQCNINDELAYLLVLPSSLISIRFKQLNLSVKGIQCILDKLSLSFESLEIENCLARELLLRNILTISSLPKVSLNLSKFTSLKNIFIRNLGYNFDSYHLLLSLSLIRLEKIKLSRIHLSRVEWMTILSKWKETNGITFFKSLKEFNLEIGCIDKYFSSQLIHLLFSFPGLEIISLDTDDWLHSETLPFPLASIKHLSLIPSERTSVGNGTTSFYNSQNLSHLTHLSATESFDVFPYELFRLDQLEYLKIYNRKHSRNCPSKVDQRCDKLRYLSIQSKYLIPLTYNFESNFPAIETLVVQSVDSKDLNFYLKAIISSKTLKCLQIHHEDYRALLSIEGEVKSSIEELKLMNINWEFISALLTAKRFPHLKKIHIKTYDCSLSIKEVLEKLSSFPLLTSLALSGDLSFSNEELPFKFEYLKFFGFQISQKTFDLSRLLCCMPNLIELRLEGDFLKELKLPNPVGIRYLTLPFNFFLHEGDYTNVIKNIPNLIQLTTVSSPFSEIKSIPFTLELAYYFQKLKEHFQNELQFEINPNCYPIQQLKNDSELLKLVRIKSPKLPKYLNRTFPIDTFKSFVKQLFTIRNEKYFNAKAIKDKLVKRFINLLSDLEVDSNNDIWFVEDVLLEGISKCLTESTDFSFDNFYKLFWNYLATNIGINLEPVHLQFIEEFFNTNKKYGPLKILNFLKSFFTSLSTVKEGSKIIYKEIFDFFSAQLLTPSLFCKTKKIGCNGKKFIPLNLESTAEDLKKLDKEQYKELSINFENYFENLSNDELSGKSLLNILQAILTAESECSFCTELLLTKEYKIFKSQEGDCHLFHGDCLDTWLQSNNTCPICRRTVESSS